MHLVAASNITCRSAVSLQTSSVGFWMFLDNCNIKGYDGTIASVSWLRPQGAVWGNKALRKLAKTCWIVTCQARLPTRAGRDGALSLLHWSRRDDAWGKIACGNTHQAIFLYSQPIQSSAGFLWYFAVVLTYRLHHNCHHHNSARPPVCVIVCLIAQALQASGRASKPEGTSPFCITSLLCRLAGLI